MISAEQKRAIGVRLRDELTALGSWKAVAKRVGANDITLRYNLQEPDKWHNVSEKMWLKVATALGMSISGPSWTIVPTTNTKMMVRMLTDARDQAMFLAVSHEAGQGKSASIELFRSADETGSTYVLECEESWSHKLFLQKLSITLGIDVEGLTVSGLTDAIVSFFKRRAADVAPLLILDEANKLKPASLRLIIPLYNKLKGQLGLVIVGADDLERHIKSGVRRQVRGYDELDSRLGRKFMHLYGATREDVYAICAANGVTSQDAQAEIFHALKPRRVSTEGEYVELIQDDLRRLERAVIDRRIRQSRNS